MQYIIFTDESYITDSRFRSISAVSFLYDHYDDFNNEFKKILSSSGVSEFKWQKLKDARYFFCANKILDLVLNCLYSFQLRIDVLIWDTQDSRHAIPGRKDIANYERMFYHLLNNSMKKRIQGANWHVYPDECCGIDWFTIKDCLSHAGRRQDRSYKLFDTFYSDPHYNIISFSEKKSDMEYAIQVADLFSGLAVFSKLSYESYISWESLQTDESLRLFDFDESIVLSNRDVYRCKILSLFNVNCKRMKLGVSLNSKKALYTFKPENPINFWHYVPQGDYDKAPV